jgi:hypothetical protein
MLLPNNELNVDLDTLKLKALLITRNIELSHETIQKLNELILNDQLSKADFIAEFNNLIQASQPKNWKIILLLNNLKSLLFSKIILISWLKVSFVLVLIALTFFIIKKFKLKKRIKKLYALLFNLFERFGALCAYFVPLVSVYTAYVPGLLSSYPYLHFIVPDSMQDAMDFYIKHPWVFNYGYFFTAMYLVTLFKLPKPRFIRFHLLRGLMLLAFQGIPDALFRTFQSADSLTQDQVVNTTLCLFAINLSWILPCLYQAITYTYPRSSFIRDAIEINLGRDKDEGFKWWDR